MRYQKINKEDVQFFQSVIGDDNVISSSDVLFDYSHDETEDLSFTPEVVLKPLNTEQISDIMIYCNSKLMNITSWFMHSSNGYRSKNEIDEIAFFEFSSCHTSESLKNVLKNIKGNAYPYFKIGSRTF